MQEILQHLKAHGEQLDSQIAAGTGISIEKVRRSLSDLSASGNLITCRLIRFEGGKKIDATLYRISAYLPPPAVGRKSKAQIAATRAASEHEHE